jgi:two-component system response regulator MtrA
MRSAVIIVVEDEPVLLEMFGMLLSGEGYQPILCADGQEAYTLTQKHQPDLVILDLDLWYDKAGMAILESLRSDPATAEIPVLMCSAHWEFLHANAMLLHKQRCATLVKPFQVSDLLLQIAQILERTRKHSLYGS